MMKFTKIYDNWGNVTTIKLFHYYFDCYKYFEYKSHIKFDNYNVDKAYLDLIEYLSNEFEILIDKSKYIIKQNNMENNRICYFIIRNIGICEISSGTESYCAINIFFKLDSNIDEIIEKINDITHLNKLIITENITKFYQISLRNNCFDSLELKIKTPIIKPEYYPNLNIDNIVNKLNNEKPGIIILSGHPGSGKSTLIKYLTSVVDKQFFNIANDMLDIFNQPSFQEFAINNLKDSVLIIEDCEKLVKSRNISNSNIATLLNLGDGLLGEALNIKIILTYNIKDDNVDSALLRKGRTLLKHEFGLIDAVNATNISKDLGKNIIYNNPIPLTEIFNTEDNNYIETKSKIGF